MTVAFKFAPHIHTGMWSLSILLPSKPSTQLRTRSVRLGTSGSGKATSRSWWDC